MTNPTGRGRKFARGRVELVPCRCCGKRTTSGIDGDLTADMCRPCYEDAGNENEHNDGHYGEQTDDNCQRCKNPAYTCSHD